MNYLHHVHIYHKYIFIERMKDYTYLNRISHLSRRIYDQPANQPVNQYVNYSKATLLCCIKTEILPTIPKHVLLIPTIQSKYSLRRWTTAMDVEHSSLLLHARLASARYRSSLACCFRPQQRVFSTSSA